MEVESYVGETDAVGSQLGPSHDLVRRTTPLWEAAAKFFAILSRRRKITGGTGCLCSLPTSGRTLAMRVHLRPENCVCRT